MSNAKSVLSKINEISYSDSLDLIYDSDLKKLQSVTAELSNLLSSVDKEISKNSDSKSKAYAAYKLLWKNDVVSKITDLKSVFSAMHYSFKDSR